MIAPLFTPAQLAAATSPESAVVIPDYPYGFRLRCMMRVWVEFRKGKGFRYVTQTSNPKRPGLVWNKPKAGTYWRVCCTISQDYGKLSPAGLSEYSTLPEYFAFLAAHGETLSPEARASVTYFQTCKEAHETACKAVGVANVYDATPAQREEIRKATFLVWREFQQAGTAY